MSQRTISKTILIRYILAICTLFVFLFSQPLITFASGTTDFSDLKDAMTLDANTSIDLNSLGLSTTGNGALSFNHAGGTTFGSDVQIGSNDLTATKLTTVDDLPTSNSAMSTRFSPDGKYLIVGFSYNPCIQAYERSGDTFTLANPFRYSTSNPNPYSFDHCNGYDIEFSDDGSYVFMVGSSMSGVHNDLIFKKDGDLYYYLADLDYPGYMTDISDVAISANGDYLAYVFGTSPYMNIYHRSGDTFSLLSNPTTLPSPNVMGTAFDSTGQYLVVTQSTSPYINIYKRSGSSFTRLSNPSTLPSGAAINPRFSPDGTYLVVPTGVSPYMLIYKRTGDTFTKLADPSSNPGSAMRNAMFSYDGKYLAIVGGTTSAHGLILYKRSGDTFTKLTDPTTQPENTGYGVSFSPDGKYLAVAYTGDWTVKRLYVYKMTGRADLNVNGGLNAWNGLYASGWNSTFDSRLTVNGLSFFNQDVTIGSSDYAANLSVRGALRVTGAVALNNTLNVGGLATFANATFTDDVTFGDPVVFQKDVAVSGKITVTSRMAGKQTINVGQQYIGVNYTSPYFATNPVITGLLAEMDMTTTQYNDYVTAGVCTTVEGLNGCRARERQAIQDTKWTIIQETTSGFQIALSAASGFKMQFNWIALETQ